MLKPQSPIARRPIVRAWLYAVAALMVLTLVVGGATRLTESGLSIVEWKPVTGIVPPLSQEAWQAEFGKYQQIPQYRELNRGMNLHEFKTIYWWEWSHRLLARLVGAAFLLPFLLFLWRGWIEPGLKARLWTLFGGGALLGCRGLVDGVIRSRRPRQRVAISSGIPSDARLRNLCSDPLDCARPRHPGVRSNATAAAADGRRSRHLGALSDLPRRAGGRARRRPVFNTWPQIDGALIPSAERLCSRARAGAICSRTH
jgi:cytochrome c oxidase assembly protein subunit 15